MKQEEINQLTVEDLNDRLITSTDKLNQLKMTHKLSFLENPLEIRALRRTIARIKTELTKRANQA